MAKASSKQPTLEEIAAHSGVSPATVSRVLNQSRSVRKESELRVKQAIKDLGFTPKQTRTRNKPSILALITPGVVDPASAAVIHGAQDEADKLGLCLVLIEVTANSGYQTQNLQLFKYFSFDGVIIDHGSLDLEQFFQKFSLTSIPVVVIAQFLDSPNFYCINSDRENGMYQAVKYLLSLNHRDIAYIGGEPGLYLSQSRLKGITRALAEVGLTLKEDYYRWGIATIDEGFQSATSILSQNADHRPTAFITYNDLMAVGTMHAVRTFGLSVPEDISVVGFNETYFTPHTNPPLTTVSQPKYREGQLAIQKIYNNLHGFDTDKGGFMLLECPLVVRESTAPCKVTGV